LTKRLCQLRIWGKIKILAEIIFIDLNTRQNFLIYEKFQLHRFYRKLADFAAGGLQGEGGWQSITMCLETKKGREGGEWRTEIWIRTFGLISIASLSIALSGHTVAVPIDFPIVESPGRSPPPPVFFQCLLYERNGSSMSTIRFHSMSRCKESVCSWTLIFYQGYLETKKNSISNFVIEWKW